MSLLTSCRTFQEIRNKTRKPHFSEDAQITKPVEKKELTVRSPNLNKLKTIKPQIIKGKVKKHESTFEEKMDALHQEIFSGKEEDLTEDAQIIEEKKSYDRFTLVMGWLAVLSSCSLVWCSIWFGWRYLTK